MAMNVTAGAIAKYRDVAERAMNRARSIAEKADEAVGTVVQTVEIGATAFGFGWAKGRYGSLEVLGVPGDLLAALVLHGFGFVSGGKYHEHLHNLGDGALASYATTLGFGIGDKMKQEADAANPPAALPGHPAAPARAPASITGGDEALSDQELAALHAKAKEKVRR